MSTAAMLTAATICNTERQTTPNSDQIFVVRAQRTDMPFHPLGIPLKKGAGMPFYRALAPPLVSVLLEKRKQVRDFVLHLGA